MQLRGLQPNWDTGLKHAPCAIQLDLAGYISRPFFSLLLNLALVSSDHIILSDPEELNLCSRGFLMIKTFFLSHIISPAMWPVSFLNPEFLDCLLMPGLLQTIQLHWLPEIWLIACALLLLQLLHCIPRQLCRCGLSTARQKPRPSAEADFGLPYLTEPKFSHLAPKGNEKTVV